MKKSLSTTAKSLSLCFLTAFAVGSLSDTTAYASPAIGPLLSHGELVDKAIVNAQNTAKVVNRHAHKLKKPELRKINQLLNEVKAISRGLPGQDDGYFGGPTSSVAVMIERNSYNFKAQGTADLLVKCMNAVKTSPGNADDIEVSVNYTRSKKARNSASWWKGSLQKCAVVSSLASDLGMKKGIGPGKAVIAFSIEGKENLTHVVRGFSPGEIGDKCMAKLGYTGSFDDLTISVNGKQLIEKKNSASYWRTKSEACRMVAKAAAQHGL